MKESGVRSQESGVRPNNFGLRAWACYPSYSGDRFDWQLNDSTRRAPARTFRDLVVWQKAHAWVLALYRMTESFPAHERYGLTSQFRRAAVSIPANIAEGFRKAGVADKKRFMNIAQGSLEECRYYLILSQDLGYADCEDSMEMLAEVSRLLDAYHKAISFHGSPTPDS